MTDAREAFRDLHDVAGHVFDTTALRVNPDPVEARVERYRAGRAVLGSLAGTAVVGIVVLGVTHRQGPHEVDPVATASASTTPDVVVTAAACHGATGIEGKPAGSLAGLEGWWNATPTAPCDEWDQVILEHPDTVTINTADNTMVEAYYRTSIDALGVYRDLGPDFVVPDPDPTWPADSIIVIDAATGEVLSSSLLSAYADTTDGVDDADGALEIDPALLEDPDALVIHADGGIAPDRAPTGFALVGEEEIDGDLMPAQIYQDADEANVSIRLIPIAGWDEEIPAGWTDMGQATYFVDGERTIANIKLEHMNLTVPIGDSAVLWVDGVHVTDPTLLRAFVWKLLT